VAAGANILGANLESLPSQGESKSGIYSAGPDSKTIKMKVVALLLAASAVAEAHCTYVPSPKISRRYIADGSRPILEACGKWSARGKGVDRGPPNKELPGEPGCVDTFCLWKSLAPP
jgi:hypothetical protein